MKFLGLNSPEIFVLSIIILIVLGPKRVEKGWFLFQNLMKFLLSINDDSSKNNSNLGFKLDIIQEEPEVIKVKEEDLEAKAEEPEVIEVKEEDLEAKAEAPEVIEVKEEDLVAKAEAPEVIEAKEEDLGAKAEEPEVIEVKEEDVEKKIMKKKPKAKKIPKEKVNK